MLERIQKIISAAGVTSRRAAEQLIAEGRVRVNGQVVTEPGSKADPSKDHIKVDGKLINPHQPPTYIMLNKPSGFVTTMSDPEGRPTVQDLLKGVKTRVYPVGRLDYNTEGLLLMTNDGDFAHLITHPKHEFPKTYLVKVKGVLDDNQIDKLEQGVFLDDGKTAPAKLKKVRKEEANSWVEITIHEGRKRQVRRMFDHVGRSVIRLKRTKTGSLVLGDLPEGSFRHLTHEEVDALRETALKTDESGRQVKVYKAPEGRPRTLAEKKKHVPAEIPMQDTRTLLRKNQMHRAAERKTFVRRDTQEEAVPRFSRRPAAGAGGSRRAFTVREGSVPRDRGGEGLGARPATRRPAAVGKRKEFGGREGFVHRERQVEAPARSGPRRPSSSRSDQQSTFGGREGFVRREARGEAPARSGPRRPSSGRSGQQSTFGGREGFVRRESQGEAPARSGPRRPSSGRPGERPAFGRRGAEQRPGQGGWKPKGARPNKSAFAGKSRGARPGPGQRPSGPGKGPRGTGSRGPRR